MSGAGAMLMRDPVQAMLAQTSLKTTLFGSTSRYYGIDTTSIVENGGSFTLPSYCMIDAFLTTGDLYLVRGQETRVALRVRNLLASRGPDPGPSGFEYPLTPREVILELRQMY